jgi:hypothetical protein
MIEEQNIEKIYDLVEKFHFDSLSKTDKATVLQHFSIEEYNNLRSTIIETNNYFKSITLGEKSTWQNKIRHIAHTSVELYKIAATILVIIGLWYVFSEWGNSTQPPLIAMADTVFVQKTDTVILKVTDTIERVKVVYNQAFNHDNAHLDYLKEEEKYSSARDCAINMCPGDIQKLSETGSRNDISNDKHLASFTVSIN